VKIGTPLQEDKLLEKKNELERLLIYFHIKLVYLYINEINLKRTPM
jgi:hypothetical protein